MKKPSKSEKELARGTSYPLDWFRSSSSYCSSREIQGLFGTATRVCDAAKELACSKHSMAKDRRGL